MSGVDRAVEGGAPAGSGGRGAVVAREAPGGRGGVEARAAPGGGGDTDAGAGPGGGGADGGAGRLGARPLADAASVPDGRRCPATPSRRRVSVRSAALLTALLVGLPVAVPPPVRAADPPPDIAGVWQQIDDRTGRVNSLVRIDVDGGEASATILEGVAAPGETLDPDQRCSACPPPFAGQRLIGLRFLWGLKGSGREWADGHILDPKEGKVYRAKATLSEDGRALTVRGYIGVSLFGRSQQWLRQAAVN